MEFLNIAYLSKVNIASLNGSEGSGGNITPIKKVSDSQGNEYAYVSGQALRRYLKETLAQLGERISAVNESGEPDFLELNENIYGKGTSNFKDVKTMYENFCDLDLFGYMLPKGGRRWSPVKVSPLMSLRPYKGDYDYLTRKQRAAEGARSGNIVQVEIDTLNFMRGNIMVEAHKIGNEINEYTYEVTPMLTEKEAAKRRNKLLDAIKYFNGGAKQSRNLEDIAPKFVVAIRQRTGNPFLLNTFNISKEDALDVKPILQALKENEGIINGLKIGMASNIFKNEQVIKEEFEMAGIKVVSVGDALDNLKIEGI
jgi:CRISPR-associated protein Cst2